MAGSMRESQFATMWCLADGQVALPGIPKCKLSFKLMCSKERLQGLPSLLMVAWPPYICVFARCRFPRGKPIIRSRTMGARDSN